MSGLCELNAVGVAIKCCHDVVDAGLQGYCLGYPSVHCGADIEGSFLIGLGNWVVVDYC